MGKFKEQLLRNNKAILKDRGMRIEKSAKREYNKIVVDLDAEVDALTDGLELMLDQSVDNRYSLQPGKQFAAEQFAADYQEKSIRLANKEIELSIARHNVDELFDDEAKKDVEK
jgi:hypothetical protein